MMSATTGDVRSCRFSSEDLRPADRIPFFCDVLGRTLARMDVEPLGERFSCNARFYRVPDLSLSWISGSAIRGTRIREMDDKSPEFVLMMNLEGAATFSQRGREVAIPAAARSWHRAQSCAAWSGQRPTFYTSVCRGRCSRRCSRIQTRH
jgi:hypothetical protein